MVEIAARRTPVIATTAWMKLLPPATRFAFYGDEKARAAALTVWGVEFSAEACRAHARSSRATLWLGPDEYLLIDDGTESEVVPSSAARTAAAIPFAGETAVAGAPPEDAPISTSTFGAAELLASLESTLADIPHALVDVSHRQFALEISGAHAANILNGACPLDLDIAEFPVGMCTRTVLAKAEIVLWRIRDDAFHVEVWRSFAGYVTGVLSEIAAEFYPGLNAG